MHNSYHRFLLSTLLLLTGLLAPMAWANDSHLTAFDHLLEHYETARQALANDTTQGVAAQGEEIKSILDQLAADFSPEAANVEAETAAEVRELLPVLTKAAAALASTTTLEAARDAFYDLSKPLVRWHKVATGERPTVAYCSMARRSWLQPEGELGNPYYGQSMLTCGETVGG